MARSNEISLTDFDSFDALTHKQVLYLGPALISPMRKGTQVVSPSL